MARDARIIMEKLGPTYVKAGQMMSVRPDIIGTRAMNELAKLQDSVPRFDGAVARKVSCRPRGAAARLLLCSLESRLRSSLAFLSRGRFNSHRRIRSQNPAPTPNHRRKRTTPHSGPRGGARPPDRGGVRGFPGGARRRRVARAGVPRQAARDGRDRRREGAAPADPRDGVEGPVRAAQGGGGVPGAHRPLRAAAGARWATLSHLVLPIAQLLWQFTGPSPLAGCAAKAQRAALRVNTNSEPSRGSAAPPQTLLL